MANTVNFAAPSDYAAEVADIERRRKLADALQMQALQPLQAPPTPAGGFAVPISPFAGLAKMLQGYAASKGQERATADMKDLAERRQAGLVQALTQYQQSKIGVPEHTVQQPVDTSQEQTGSMDMSGSNGPPTQPTQVPAVTGDPRAAIMSGMASQYPEMRTIAGMDYTNLNKPPIKINVGDKEILVDPTTHQTVASFDVGIKPDTQFTEAGKNQRFAGVSGDTQATQQGADRRFAGVSGNAQLGAQTAMRGQNMSQGTAIRGQNLTDARARELNGIMEGQGPADLTPTATAIANHDLPMPPPPSGSRNPMALVRYNDLVKRVKDINPTYNAIDYQVSQKALKDFGTGKQGQEAQAANTGVNHLATLVELAKAQKNGDVQLFNKISREIGAQFGQAAPTNLQAAITMVGPEVTKAVVGAGGGVGDREKTAAALNPNYSPDQFLGAAGTMTNLFAGRLSEAERTYARTTMRKDFRDRILSPAAKQILDARPIEGGDAPKMPEFATLEAASAAKLAPGTRIKVGGVEGTWH